MSDELALLDATAQAALVRDGEASPVELVDAAIERIEALNGELNAVIHPLFEQAREAASGELPGWPLQGRAVPAQGPRRRLRRRSAAHGDAVPQGGGVPIASRHLPGAALPRRRLRHRGQDQHPRARHRADHGARCLWRHPQPLGPLSLAGRLKRRIRSRGRLGHGAGGPRQRRRRLDPHPGERLRAGRPEADPAANLGGPPGRRPHVRAERGAGGFEIGARHRRGPRRRPRPGAR